MSFPDLQRATETHPPPERASQKDRGRERDEWRKRGKRKEVGDGMERRKLIKKRQGEIVCEREEWEMRLRKRRTLE